MRGAGGVGHGDWSAQRARNLVHGEARDAVRVLVRDEEVRPVRAQAQAPRCLSSARRAPRQSQHRPCPFPRTAAAAWPPVNGKGCNRVVEARRSEEPAARGVNGQVRRPAALIEGGPRASTCQSGVAVRGRA